MADIFISYSRKDKDFVTRLHEALKARQRQAWVDLEDIPPTAEWREKIKAGIEGARAFVFVLSPDSMASPECLKEVEHAAASHKRRIPVVCRDVDSKAVPEALGKFNWIFLREQDDFEKGGHSPHRSGHRPRVGGRPHQPFGEGHGVGPQGPG